MIRGAVLVLAALALPACGGERPPRATARKELGARWQDVFEGTPDIFVIVRPQAIKRDAVYGSLWRSVLRVAQAKSWVGGETTLQAAEGSDEIIIGINKGADAALVLRGVPANLDPHKITDEGGQPLFRLVDERAKIQEFELIGRKSADAGAVFILDNRTWVGTIGDARVRARQAFASPLGRPVPKVDPDALAAVRFGTPVVQRPAFARSAVFGPLTRKLASATFALRPAKGGVVVTFQYDDADASAWAENHVKRIVEELGKDEQQRFAWLKETKIAIEGTNVVVKLAVPPRLLEELPKASGADVAL